LFVIYSFYRHIQFIQGKLFIASTILSFSGLLINLVYTIIIINSVHAVEANLRVRSMLTPYFSLWFYLAIILYVMCIVISLKFIKKRAVKPPSY
jgi:glucan phosphoethanolaminetransferase (alkaline phosphatase superfamily)